jgi:hypothetical protein
LARLYLARKRSGFESPSLHKQAENDRYQSVGLSSISVSCYDIPSVDIAPSGRKHQATDGFDDDDIRHAVAFALYAAEDGDDPDKSI